MCAKSDLSMVNKGLATPPAGNSDTAGEIKERNFRGVNWMGRLKAIADDGKNSCMMKLGDKTCARLNAKKEEGCEVPLKRKSKLHN